MGLVSSILGCLALGIRSMALAGILVVNANTSDPAPRQVWQSVVEDFHKEHPEIQVKFNIYDQESYKKSIRNWLTGAAPDVVFWNVGYRMRQFVTPGLLENVSDLYTKDLRQQFSNAALDLVTVAGPNTACRCRSTRSGYTTARICCNRWASMKPRSLAGSPSRL
jgi:ABC-type glycerol-3-phosphate transport system substrate-binding protein